MSASSPVTGLIIATRNAHKVGEIRAILGGHIQYSTLNDYANAPRVIEDAQTFAGNAKKKAVELARWLSGSRCPGQRSGRALSEICRSGLARRRRQFVGRSEQRQAAEPFEECADGKTHRAVSLRIGLHTGLAR